MPNCVAGVSVPRVLVGCERSGRVRDALRRHGIDATSCDLLPSDAPGPHIRGDVRDVLRDGWDAAVFFPPCTFLSVSGLFRNIGNPKRQAMTDDALRFVSELWAAPIPYMAIENPRGCISTRLNLAAAQTVQPWQFGEDASKATCLWLKRFPLLEPTRLVEPRTTADGRKRWANQTDSGQNRLSPSPQRATLRGLTYPGIADAMGEQWARALHERTTFRLVA